MRRLRALPCVDDCEPDAIIARAGAAVADELAIDDLRGDVDASVVVSKRKAACGVGASAERLKELVGPLAEHAVDAHHLARQLLKTEGRIGSGARADEGER